jgi:serine/threonine protein kinase
MRTVESEQEAAILDGRYELGECVGVGGTARVYRARDILLGRTVAVKLMREDDDGLPSPDRVGTEMKVLATLRSPSLVKLLDGAIEPGRARYLVMEFVDGETLAARLQNGGLPPGDVAHIAVELASALHVVHQAGVVHRDLKPSNVLIAPSALPGGHPQVKLSDFGVARFVDSARVTSAGTVVGTGMYLAPEQVRGEEPRPATDIYALGLLLLEALTGERPYGHLTGIGQVMARLIDPPVVPEGLGTAWTHLLNRMTATDPDRRPAALDVLEAATAISTGAESLPNPAAEPAITEQAPIAVSSSQPHTRPLPVHTDAAHSPPITSRRRRSRLIPAATVAGSVAVALVIAIGPNAGTTQESPADGPLSGLHVVTDAPVGQDLTNAQTAEQPVVVVTDSGAAVTEQPDPVVSDHAPVDPQQQAASDRRQQAAADREAAEAQREAQKEQRRQAREEANGQRRNR